MGFCTGHREDGRHEKLTRTPGRLGAGVGRRVGWHVGDVEGTEETLGREEGLGELDGLGDAVGRMEGSIDVEGAVDEVGWTVGKADS
jgi:hypothetical protein